MISRRLLDPLTVVGLAFCGLSRGYAQDTDLGAIKAQLDEMKKQYESRIENLEKRIDSLEADNARLKHQAKAETSESSPEEVAALKSRVKVLETNQKEAST